MNTTERAAAIEKAENAEDGEEEEEEAKNKKDTEKTHKNDFDYVYGKSKQHSFVDFLFLPFSCFCDCHLTSYQPWFTCTQINVRNACVFTPEKPQQKIIATMAYDPLLE